LCNGTDVHMDIQIQLLLVVFMCFWLGYRLVSELRVPTTQQNVSKTV